MADQIDWGKLYTDSGEADEALPPGPYDVEVTKCEAKTTKTGKPMFTLSAKVLSGPKAGRFVFHNITVTVENPNAMRMFFVNMAAFGLKEDFFKGNPSNEAVAQALVGRRAKFEVGIQTSGAYAGRNEVKKVSAPSTPAATVGPSAVAPGSPSPVPPAAATASVPSVPVPSGDIPKPGF